MGESVKFSSTVKKSSDGQVLMRMLFFSLSSLNIYIYNGHVLFLSLSLSFSLCGLSGTDRGTNAGHGCPMSIRIGWTKLSCPYNVTSMSQ